MARCARGKAATGPGQYHGAFNAVIIRGWWFHRSSMGVAGLVQVQWRVVVAVDVDAVGKG